MIKRKLAASLVTLLVLAGCSQQDNNDTQQQEQPTTNSTLLQDLGIVDSDSFFGSFTPDWVDDIINWWNDDGEPQADLMEQLSALADTATDANTFVREGLRITVEYVVNEYFSFASSYLLDNDWGENDDQYLYEYMYETSEALVTYMQELYDEFTSPARAASTSDLLQKIIDEIYNIIVQLIEDFFGVGASVSVDVDVSDTGVRIDPNQHFAFSMDDVAGKKFYVASKQYMDVTFSQDGLSGRGEIGYGIGADFNSSIVNEKLLIDMNGIYEVEMLYKDAGYCLATHMVDTTDNTEYFAYWFSDADVYDKASNMTKAKALCYIHSTEYQPLEIAQDGELEPIADVRSGHSPVATADTSTMVSELINGVDNTANVQDAKYFARKMRHGIFAIYTTNNQTHTLQAQESEKIQRELLPMAAASAVNVEKLLNGAYEASSAFQTEINEGLSTPASAITNRFDELITATSQAMDRTTSANGYHGISDTTSFGDVVEFEATNIQSECGVAFFLCNTATADVEMRISNPTQQDGNKADVRFKTHIQTSIIGSSAVEFNEVNAAQSVNYLSANDYRLDITDFVYTRNDGVMKIQGSGSLGSDARLEISHYNADAKFTENPLALVDFSIDIDGVITTLSGRRFDGNLLFDGQNTNNTAMNGTLVGIGDEPKIEGLFKTSLDAQTITEWYDTHEGASLQDSSDLDNIGDQSYFMNMKITDTGITVQTDMLVERNEAADTWRYNLENLLVEDANLHMEIESVYLVQKGQNTIASTLEKLALNGVSLDSDINTLINVGWDIAKDFNAIGIEKFNVVMKPESGDVDIKATLHVNNPDDTTMQADLNASYDYATTHLTSVGNFETVVDSSGEQNSYTNSFETHGVIAVENKYDYRYALSYTDSVQDMLFTTTQNSYQMGFRIDNGIISGGDSYGIVAKFIMNETYDILENMQLRNTDSDPLGLYNRSEDRLKIKFADGVEEYMYLY